MSRRETRLEEMQQTLRGHRSSEPARTIEESFATAVVDASPRHLVELARRAFRRGYRDTLLLIHAEFLRRRRDDKAVA